MIHFIQEGDALRNGINIYRWNDPRNSGFKLRIHRFVFMCRWSKLRKKWFVHHWTVPKIPSEFYSKIPPGVK